MERSHIISAGNGWGEAKSDCSLQLLADVWALLFRTSNFGIVVLVIEKCTQSHPAPSKFIKIIIIKKIVYM